MYLGVSVGVGCILKWSPGLFFGLLRKMKKKLIGHRIIMTWRERESTCREVDYNLRGKLAPAAGGSLFHFCERNDSYSLVESVN